VDIRGAFGLMPKHIPPTADAPAVFGFAPTVFRFAPVVFGYRLIWHPLIATSMRLCSSTLANRRWKNWLPTRLWTLQMVGVWLGENKECQVLEGGK
jgi:hypothetical protein